MTMPLVDDDIVGRLKVRYNEGRAYHNWDHIQAMLRLLKEYEHLAHDYEAVEAAIYFHDVIYDSRNRDNEDRSAALALDWLRDRTTAKRLTNIASAILATKYHKVPDALTGPEIQDVELLLDADLSILGSDPAEFEAYDAAIRQEYSWVPETDWRAGRKAVLHRFLDRPRIYHLDAFHDMFEAKARLNLEHALKLLGTT